MSLYTDYVAFVDAGSKVPYFVNGVKYSYKPNVYTEFFVFDFKEYYKSYNSYYVGIASSNFVRKILVSDFKMMKEEYLKSVADSSISKKVQLVFGF